MDVVDGKTSVSAAIIALAIAIVTLVPVPESLVIPLSAATAVIAAAAALQVHLGVFSSEKGRGYILAYILLGFTSIRLFMGTLEK